MLIDGSPGATSEIVMATGPYDHVFRKMPPKTKPPVASSSDVHHETEAPLVTDLKTLELFARALNDFSAAQSKTMTQRNRYRTSTLSLSFVLGIVLTIVGVREIRIGMDPAPPTSDPTGLDWSQIEAKIEARLGQSTKPKSEESAVDHTDPTVALLHAQIAVLLRLRIEQDKYAEAILQSPTKRHLPKPQSLIDAERAADAILSGQ
jgi:hypothetical protein